MARAVFSIVKLHRSSRRAVGRYTEPPVCHLRARERLRSIAPTFGRGRRFLSQGVNDEANDCDADAGIGDVEGWPRVGEANVQIEEKKIGDMTVGQFDR